MILLAKPAIYRLSRLVDVSCVFFLLFPFATHKGGGGGEQALQSFPERDHRNSKPMTEAPEGDPRSMGTHCPIRGRRTQWADHEIPGARASRHASNL